MLFDIRCMLPTSKISVVFLTKQILIAAHADKVQFEKGNAERRDIWHGFHNSLKDRCEQQIPVTITLLKAFYSLEGL